MFIFWTRHISFRNIAAVGTNPTAAAAEIFKDTDSELQQYPIIQKLHDCLRNKISAHLGFLGRVVYGSLKLYGSAAAARALRSMCLGPVVNFSSWRSRSYLEATAAVRVQHYKYCFVFLTPPLHIIFFFLRSR